MKKLSQYRYGSLALLVAILEPAIIWGSVAAVDATGVWAPPWVLSALRWVYVVGLSSLGLAVFGLVKDAWRVVAFFALLLALLDLAVCVPPLAL